MTYPKIFFIALSFFLALGATLIQVLLSPHISRNAQALLLFISILTVAAIIRLSNGLAERFARLMGNLFFASWMRKVIAQFTKQTIVIAPTFTKSSGKKEEILCEEIPYETVLNDLSSDGISHQELHVDEVGFQNYLNTAQYALYHPNYYKNAPKYKLHKQIQHYLSTLLTPVETGEEVWMDVASSTSPFPEIMTRQYGIKVYSQDLTYAAGVNGLFVGSNANSIPLPDASIQRISLHCSFEHFEGDADSGFMYELARILSPGGMAAIIPLYLSNTYQLLSHPRYWLQRGIPHEPPAQLTLSHTYWESHGRFYNAEALQKRVLLPLEKSGLTYQLYKIIVPNTIDYPPFPALVVHKS